VPIGKIFLPLALVVCACRFGCVCDVDWNWGLIKSRHASLSAKNLSKAEHIIRFVPFAQALSILCSFIILVSSHYSMVLLYLSNHTTITSTAQRQVEVELSPVSLRHI
jgi:hypothetical protein